MDGTSLKQFISLPAIGEGAGTSLGTLSVPVYPSLESSSSHLLFACGRELFCALVKVSQGVNLNSRQALSANSHEEDRLAGAKPAPDVAFLPQRPWRRPQAQLVPSKHLESFVEAHPTAALEAEEIA